MEEVRQQPKRPASVLMLRCSIILARVIGKAYSPGMTYIDSGLAPPRLAARDTDFSPNPASLTMQYYLPPGLRRGAPLVVLLHGCRQEAADFATGGGWLTLAARHGFAVLAPGQNRGNNPMGCFSWFEPAAVAREGGEVASILAMIEAMLDRHGLDRRRVFVSGLSAGGAMAAALLATAPDIFAGGGIIAGLPFGAAASAQDAFAAMREPRPAIGREWGDRVRAASAFAGRRPAVSIWQGTADRTVAPANADLLEAQWADVLGLDLARMVTEQHGRHECRLWRDWLGQIRLRRWTIEGLGHGTPISPRAPEEMRRLGAPSRFMLECELGSTWLLARDWGLVGEDDPETTGVAGLLRATLRAARLFP